MSRPRPTDDAQRRLTLVAPEVEETPATPAPKDREPQRFEGATRPKARLALAVAVFAVWVVAVGVRLVDLQLVHGAEYREKADAQQRQQVRLEAPRGTIFDREGRELAVSVDALSVALHPFELEDVRVAAKALAPHLGRSAAQLQQKIEDALREEKHFLWLSRKLDAGRVDRIRALDLEGVSFIPESRRFYPQGTLAAATLGFVGTDPKGLAGVEAMYEKAMRGREVVRQIVKDSRNNTLVVPTALDQTPRPGANVHLTLDATLQHIAETVLAERVEWSGAKAGSVVILDPRDSAVLALANYPFFDPARFNRVPQSQWRNRVIAEPFEPGSTFKMITAAAAIESGAVHADDEFDCENGAIRLDRRTRIRDHKPFGVLTFREILAKSSNVGVIKAALRTGEDGLFEMTQRFGFGRHTGIDLPGEQAGMVHPIEKWKSKWGAAYVSFGHYLTVTPIQMANAYAAVANGGVMHRPYLVRAIERDGTLEPTPRPEGTRVLSRAMSQELIRLLEGVVAEKGTAWRAAIDGYRVAGKTGTAEKSSAQGYSDTGRMASFVGIAPARDPQLVCMVVLDEPTFSVNGGRVAAPTYREIVSRALVHLGVPRSAPSPSDIADEEEEPRFPEPLVLPKRRAPTVAAGGGP